MAPLTMVSTKVSMTLPRRIAPAFLICIPPSSIHVPKGGIKAAVDLCVRISYAHYLKLREGPFHVMSELDRIVA